MYVTRKFQIEEDFFSSARRAIKEENKKNGYPPREVIVHPWTDIGEEKMVVVILANKVHFIPLKVRDDLRIGFELKDDEAMLDVCNPFSLLE